MPDVCYTEFANRHDVSKSEDENDYCYGDLKSSSKAYCEQFFFSWVNAAGIYTGTLCEYADGKCRQNGGNEAIRTVCPAEVFQESQQEQPFPHKCSPFADRKNVRIEGDNAECSTGGRNANEIVCNEYYKQLTDSTA
eukprot:2107172-Pleurochrysis_carterae.AAC.1